MARQGINTGTSPNDGLGDSLLTGAIKINSNFLEIYNTFGDGNTLNPGMGYGSTTNALYANVAGIATVAQGLTGTPSIDVYRLGISSSINVGAASTFQKSVHFESTLLIGDTDELQIFHDGNNSYIDNASAGNLILRDSGTGIQLKKTSGALMGVFNNDAGVELYYNGVLKFQTFQNGVAINESVGIGSTAGNPPYRLTVSGVGATITQGLVNAIADFTSSVNGYGQLNVRNSLSGTNASGDIVVTANTGNDTSNFIDFGINNSGFTTSSWTINGALDGYLYTSDGNLSIGAASTSKYLSLFAGGTLASNEQVRVTTTGVGIGTTNVTSKLTVGGDVRVSGVVTATNFYGDGSGLTGIVAAGSGVVIKDDGSTVGTAGTIDFGTGLSVSPISAGVVTVTSSGGTSSQWVTTNAGIHTLSNVGIGTTNAEYKFQVKGQVLLGGNSADAYLAIYDDNNGNNISIESYNLTNSVKKNITLGAYGGNTGFGTTNPTSRVTVQGDVRVSGVVTASRFESTSAGTPTIDSPNNLNINAVNVAISTDVTVGSDLSVSGNTLVTGITTVGLANTSSPPSNSQMSFELTSNTNLRIKVRGTDGVLRSADITLA